MAKYACSTHTIHTQLLCIIRKFVSTNAGNYNHLYSSLHTTDYPHPKRRMWQWIYQVCTYPYLPCSWRCSCTETDGSGNVWCVGRRRHSREIHSLLLLGTAGNPPGRWQSSCGGSWHASVHLMCWCRLYYTRAVTRHNDNIVCSTVLK